MNPRRMVQLTICLTLSGLLILTSCNNGGSSSGSIETIGQDSIEEPTNFSVSNLTILKREVKIRENVGINVLVTNNSDEKATYTIELRINNEITTSTDVTLAGGDSEMVSFKNNQDTPGNYTVAIDNLSDMFVVIPPPSLLEGEQSGEQQDESDTSIPDTPLIDDDWVITQGSGSNYCAVHMGGNWGTTRDAVNDLPSEYFEYLRDLNVKWVGVSVALHIDGSMDSTVEFKYTDVNIPTFRDEVLRELIQTYRRHGFNVYIHVAFESGMQGEYPVQRWQLGDPTIHDIAPDILAEFWPWRIDHPQHEEFVAEFWQTYTDCLVHIAEIAEEEGVGMMTLGTETDRLFRSRSGGQWPNHFLNEMQAMVEVVRGAYGGMLSYEQLHNTLVNRSFFGPGSDYLVKDLDLDFVAVSAYFQLDSSTPNRVMTVEELETSWEGIFQQHLIPLQSRNPGKPIIFTEFGYTDSIGSPNMASADEFRDKLFKDKDENGLDDGEETQTHCIGAFFNVMDRHSDVVTGSFIWGLQMATNAQYQQSFANMRTFNIRGKLAEDVVRLQYAEWSN
ncbi:hypothetical protein ACFLXP_06295 [Chloroflexota bacterium]